MSSLLAIVIVLLIAVLVFAAIASLAALSANNVRDGVQFYQSQFTESAEVELSDLFIFTDTRKLFWINVVLLLIVPLLVHLFFDLWLVSAMVFLILLLVPGFLWRFFRNRRLNKFETQLPDAFMMLSSSLQAGASLNMALEDLVRQSPAPLNQEFGLLIKRMRLGVNLEDALLELEKRLPLPAFVMASSAIRISREVGGNLVQTINNMAATLRRKKTMEGKIDSLTAQGRAQGVFMALLPVFLAAILSFLEPNAMRQLFTTQTGVLVLSIMLVMEVAGFVFIQKITRIDS